MIVDKFVDATFIEPIAQILNTGLSNDLNPEEREQNKTFLTKCLKRKLSLVLQKISYTEICLVI